jgi:hypothetical protein
VAPFLGPQRNDLLRTDTYLGSFGDQRYDHNRYNLASIVSRLSLPDGQNVKKTNRKKNITVSQLLCNPVLR